MPNKPIIETSALHIKNFLREDTVLVDYQSALDAMKLFTRERDSSTTDQLWTLEHPPVYTLGQAGDPAHILNPTDIPIIKVDRGGQVTYHGPGQLMFYLLADLSKLDLNVRQLVEVMERAVINMLADYQIIAAGNRQAPGVYVENKKIAALGFRISRRRCYHGLCFNYNFDAVPFSDINPCGYEGMQVTQLASLVSSLPSKKDVAKRLADELISALGYNRIEQTEVTWV